MLHHRWVVLFSLLLIFFGVSCKRSLPNIDGVQIAFLSDVHLSDLYGSLEYVDYKGVMNPETHKYVLMRTMESQLHSTRLFNENYYAFLAALDDIARRNIKLVMLPGDYSDDGQPYNLRGLERILRSYSDSYGIKFFITSGNHDPVMPFTIDAGKADYLGEGGRKQAIFSKNDPSIFISDDEHPVVISSDVCKLGYEDILNIMGRNGIAPQRDYVYWETPFSSYSYENYSFDKAVSESKFSLRQYVADSSGVSLPDVSYLVEPMDGLWLLSLDGNVYLPSDDGDFRKAPLASGGEYSNIVKHKKHLLTWMRNVTYEAKRLNKTLITFSHYPMVDFHDGATDDLNALLGVHKMQLFRVPNDSIARIFADMGIKIHFAGHLHLNDTGVRQFDDDNFIVNVQIPSLAGYPAAYKLLTIRNNRFFDVETVRIDTVPRFNELFPLYEGEYAYLQSSKAADIWDRRVLDAQSYGELVDMHLRELVRLRFIPNDWPIELKDLMLKSTGYELLQYSGSSVSDSLLFNWSGFDMIVDFYRLVNGDQLAIYDIGSTRLMQYCMIIDSVLNDFDNQQLTIDNQYSDFMLFLRAFRSMLDNAEPSDHFRIDMKNGLITDFNN